MVLSYLNTFSYMLRNKTVNIYNVIFKLHTKYTVLFLLSFGFLASANSIFGEPIKCLLDSSAGVGYYVENVCWAIGSFSSTDVTTGRLVHYGRGYSTIQSVPKYHTYYQWVAIVLQLQAILFYAPAFYWKGWENGRLRELCSNLGSPVIADDDDYQDDKKRLVDYLTSDNTRVHSAYFMRRAFCEVMNFLILLLNMWIIDAMFNQFWVRYLTAVLALIKMDGEKFAVLANELFPKLVKCVYTDTGPSGSEQLRDAFCLLSLNVINEKIFAFLYIWFVVLLFLSTCYMIFRCISLVSQNMRLKMVQSLVTSSKPTAKTHIEYILRDGKIGNWFILYEIGRNINPTVFETVLVEVANNKRNYNDFLNNREKHE